MLEEWWRINISQSAVVDRIVDENTAVLIFAAGREQLLVPVEKLPAGSTEGSWLLVRVEDGELVAAELDPEKTEAVRERIRSKREILLERMARRRRRN